MWLIEAERTYRIAQALPGWTRTETLDTPGFELDNIVAVASAYRAALSSRDVRE